MTDKELLEATCPECRGPLSQRHRDGGVVEYSCLVGHKYSARALLQAHSEAQEKALWAAVVALEEATTLIQSVAPYFPPEVFAVLQRQAEIKRTQAQQIRDLLERLEPFQTI